MSEVEQPEPEQEQEHEEEQFDFPMPPASFDFLVMSLRAQAEMQLGLMPYGQQEKPQPQLNMARHTIDLMGVLLEKTMGLRESRLATWLGGLLNLFVIPRNLGFVLGPDGAMQLLAGLVRIPDVAFISWDRVPDRKMPTAPVPLLAPNLAIEVLSKNNTPGEMAVKRQDTVQRCSLLEQRLRKFEEGPVVPEGAARE